jgi:hypothetical protein
MGLSPRKELRVLCSKRVVHVYFEPYITPSHADGIVHRRASMQLASCLLAAPDGRHGRQLVHLCDAPSPAARPHLPHSPESIFALLA